MKVLFKFALVLFFSSGTAHAVTIGFSEIWSSIQEEHPELRATMEEWKAADENVARGSRHWLPSLFLTGRGFSTNDAGMNLFGNLGQRSVTVADFSPASMNNPGYHTFLQLGLGINLPLFEGGGSVSYARMLDRERLVKDELNSSAKLNAYSAAISDYAGVLSANESLKSLEGLRIKVAGVLSRYSVGSKSNPVGYSGLLGLRAVLNRIDVEINIVKNAKTLKKTGLVERSKKINHDWEPQDQSTSKFLSEVMPEKELLLVADSHQVSAALAGAEMMDEKIGFEKSHFLPQIGLFGQGDHFAGSRSNSTSYTGGVYLQWSLFNPRDFGKVSESKHQFAAVQAKADAGRLEEKIGRSSLVDSLKTIGENEKLLSDSMNLMSEQVNTAARLFQSGSINALQLAEVYNRETDLIRQWNELNQQNIVVRTSLAKLSRMKGFQP